MRTLLLSVLPTSFPTYVAEQRILAYVDGSLHRSRLRYTGFLFSRYKYALPSLKKRIIYESGDSEVKELEQTSFNVAASCKKPADSDGDGKRLNDKRYMYQPEIENNVVDGYDQHWYKHKWYHHDWIENHWHTKCHWFIDIKYRRSKGYLSYYTQLCRT